MKLESVWICHCGGFQPYQNTYQVYHSNAFLHEPDPNGETQWWDYEMEGLNRPFMHIHNDTARWCPFTTPRTTAGQVKEWSRNSARKFKRLQIKGQSYFI